MRRLRYNGCGRLDIVRPGISRSGIGRPDIVRRPMLGNAAAYVFLSILTAGFCYLFCYRYGVFGAKVDWISQHSVLPDYFRQQFYETGEWFPEFAANIGGGQNIYHFAYYGLYNPIFLFSYLLPFVKMSDYMMAAQFLGLTASVLLLYAWLRRKDFSERICVGTAVLFLLAGPMIVHSYSQIMFVNYMPFLLMGLWGADRYFEDMDGGARPAKRHGVMLTVGIFLMIMTSFYFSIGGMLVLLLYGIHRYLMVCDELGRKVTVRAFFLEGLRFCVPFVTAVMMGGILLLPTALALTGRKGEGAGLGLGDLLIPKMPASRFCYSTHGIGLTTLALTALIAMIFAKKLHDRVLAVSCLVVLTVPVFAYLLNGGLYVRDKAMIPFLPLLCYILACYLSAQDGTKASPVKLIPYIVTVVMIYVCRRQGEAGGYWKLLLLDGVVMLICCGVLLLWRNLEAKSALLLLPSVLMLIVFGNACHAQGSRAVSREFYEEVTDSGIGQLIAKVTKEEEGFYRTEQLGDNEVNAANLNRVWSMGQYLSSVYSSSYHEGYREFREETFQLEEPFRNFLMQSAVHNPVYQRFMGIKYVVSKEEVPGYEAVESGSGWKVYEDTGASPVIYATDRVMTEKDYEKLKFPYNQLALLKYAVVQDTAEGSERAAEGDAAEGGKRAAEGDAAESGECAAEGGKRAAEGDAKRTAEVSLNMPKQVDSDQNETVSLKLPISQEKEAEERILFLKFQVKNLRPTKDVTVEVEGVRNKLTAKNHFYYNANTEFAYAIPLEDGQEAVEVLLGKGKYKITDVEGYVSPLPNGEENGLYQSKFRLDRAETKGNCIAGTIEAEKPGYLVTTIPYDKNFEILVDGKRTEGEVVNTAFLGLRIDAGKHDVKMIYHAPGVAAGRALSMAGVLLLVLWNFRFVLVHRKISS